MKVYIKNHTFGAGKWIYKGYAAAWKLLGYDVEFFNDLKELEGSGYYLMALDGEVTAETYPALERAAKTFLYVQPTHFPSPWGSHPNFVSTCASNVIREINSASNVYKWTFTDVSEYHEEWENVNTIPLAFDSINYLFKQEEKYAWDVCFVGGWADNGFNEKKKIMIEHFSKFKDSGLRCGIFINQNISHEEETLILSSSKIAINIHDAYQRFLGLDTNERTFKSLGLCGFLISDEIGQYKRLFPDNPTANTSEQMISLVLKYMSEDLSDIKKKNRKHILKEHTYLNRVKQMITL